MSDSTTNIDQIDPSQSQKEVPANAYMDAASPAALFARRDAGFSNGLTWAYYGGRFNGTLINNGTLSLTASATNYIVVHKTTLAISVATSSTNWNNTSTYGRLYKVTASGSTATSWEDHRAGNDGTGILSGGSAPASSSGVSASGSTGDVQFSGGGSPNSISADSRLNFDATTGITTGQFAVGSAAINAQTGTSYTLVATDNGKVITLNNASAITVSVPSGLAVGFSCVLIQIGAGQASILSAGSPPDVTINPSATFKTAAQHAAVSLIQYASGVFNLSGNLA